MKIYIILWEFKKSNGACRAVANLANLLADNFDVTIVCTDTLSGKSYYPLNDKINIQHLGIPVAKNFFDKFRRKKELIVKLKDVVENNACVIGTNTTYNLILHKIRNIKRIGCEHINYEALPFIYRLMRRFIYRKLDKVVLLTEVDRKKYKFLRNTCVIPNSYSFKPKKINDYSKKNIIAIGRLTYQKGFDMLVDAAVLLKSKLPDWKVKIVGDGEDKEKLLDKIKENDVSDFISIIPPKIDVVDIYHSASIYVMSSRFEGLPMVLIEAQSCGLPIVSFDCPEGPSEIIHDNIDGYLVEKNNIQALVEKVIYLANDENLRKQFGQNAFIASERYSSDVVKSKWLELILGEMK